MLFRATYCVPGLAFLVLSLSAAQSSAPTAPAAANDPLGRSTPRGTVVEFLRAAGDARDTTAAQYLEVGGRAGNPSSSATRELARKLKAVLDGTTSIRLNEISNRPEGVLDDGLPPDSERIAAIQTRSREAEITLHRITPAGAAPIWLFSADTLRQVPTLYSDLTPPALERFVPAALTGRKVFDVDLWRWLALLIMIPLAFALASALTAVALSVARSITRRTSAQVDDRIVPLLRGPMRLFLSVSLFHPGMLSLDLPLLLRQGLGQMELVAAVFAIAWFAMRLIDLASAEANRALVASQRAAALSIVPLGRRVVKVAAVSLAVLVVLDNAGFDLKALLTGLGVGGIAVALAAQKTLENIFGAIALVLDQPVRVGDFCKFDGNVGTVEDIGLRSTRIRTLDRTIVSVPNSQFASMNLETFAPREKVWFHPVLALRLDTTAAQTRAIRDKIQNLLATHPKMEKGARIRLNGLGDAAIKLEVFAYVATANYDEFVVIQEDLLLAMLDIVEAEGTSIAMPAQSGYITRPDSEPRA